MVLCSGWCFHPYNGPALHVMIPKKKIRKKKLITKIVSKPNSWENLACKRMNDDQIVSPKTMSFAVVQFQLEFWFPGCWVNENESNISDSIWLVIFGSTAVIVASDVHPYARDSLCPFIDGGSDNLFIFTLPPHIMIFQEFAKTKPKIIIFICM